MNKQQAKHLSRVHDLPCCLCGSMPVEAHEDLVRSIRSHFDYKDGHLIRIIGRGNRGKVGSIAGGFDAYGYIQIQFNGKLWKAHRLVWLWHGRTLPDQIDHIDGDKSNNRIENLRPASKSQNAMNSKRPAHNTSGVKGVSYSSQHQKWAARIQVNGVSKSLGLYESISDASEAYKTASNKMFGEFARCE